MNIAKRMLAVATLALAAGATMGVPSASATTGGAPSTQSAESRVLHPDRDRIVGYFRNPFACHRAGRIGEMRDRWEDYDCERVRRGIRRGMWALTVRWDGGGNNGGGHNGGGWPGGGHDGGGWPGGGNNNGGGGGNNNGGGSGHHRGR